MTKMNIRPIKSERDYDWALREIERYFEREPRRGTPDADRFDILATLIESYEARYWPIDPPDPIEAIRFRIGDNWFRYQRGPSDPFDMSVSEDFWFYRAAREAGYACYGDWDVVCLHLQTMAIDRSWNQAYLDGQVRELPTMTPEARQTVLNSLVVCGFPDGMSLPTGDHIPPYVLSPGER